MIFRCSDQGCGYFGEGPRLPEFCPRCGKRMLQAAEGEMTARSGGRPPPGFLALSAGRGDGEPVGGVQSGRLL